ncbi:uncharacterized protein [Procambarus clarkii]|uniref:uncharacterized protein n=1 Tax=Procambarus clarkii TaxID=6728 RepID=UPI001E6773BE|nr:uncharacterized protein LOC123770633 [Procambarus clarkii]
MPWRWGKSRPRAAPKAAGQPHGESNKPQGVWTVSSAPAAGEGVPQEEGVAQDVLHGPLLLIRVTLRGLGMVPYRYSCASRRYELRWRSWRGAHTLAVLVWLSGLVVSTCVGLATVFLQAQPVRATASGSHEVQLMGMAIIVGCLLNAWVEVLNLVMLGQPLCAFLNQWQQLAARTTLDPTRGLRLASCVYAIFLYAFVVAVLVVAVLGPPAMLMDIVDLLAQVLFLVDPRWLAQDTLPVQVVRVVVGMVVGHLYMVYKGSLFLFVTICHMLHNVLECWRHQLAHTLHVAWEGAGDVVEEPVWGCSQMVQLEQLVQSHWQVVVMVRKTEHLFSSTLQCFYATQVVTLCLELYLVAYRIGAGAGYAGQEAAWQTIIIFQTCIVFFLVSLKASRVYEEAERCVDVLRRGLPYTASEKDKHHYGELTLALTASPICISGGRFFYINRPFIITVVGAVVSYFIIVLQLKHPSVSGQDVLATTALNHSV